MPQRWHEVFQLSRTPMGTSATGGSRRIDFFCTLSTVRDSDEEEEFTGEFPESTTNDSIRNPKFEKHDKIVLGTTFTEGVVKGRSYDEEKSHWLFKVEETGGKNVKSHDLVEKNMQSQESFNGQGKRGGC